jgi:cytochrome oxidase Cu insertion factor (SCO1/SenC/PrrC family)
MIEHDPTPSAVHDERSQGVTPEERTAALAAGAPRVPRRVVAWMFVAAAILGLGGTVAERAFTAAGLNSSAGVPTTTTASSLPLTTIPTPTTGPLSSSGALLALVRLRPVVAPNFQLVDQLGKVISLDDERGRVVVLTFFNADCQDACPVIAAELRQASADLGSLRSQVVFLTVNTDPLDLSVVPTPPAVTRSGLASLHNWYYLTGSVHQLDPVWNALGVSISVYVDERIAVHNDVLYLIDPKGDLVIRGTPFSDENHQGAYSLPTSLVHLAAHGLAVAVGTLLGEHR